MNKPPNSVRFLPKPTSAAPSIRNHGSDGQNLYFLWPRHQEPIRLSLDACHRELDGAITYLARTLKLLEERYGCRGLTFYLTYDTMNELPTYGSNVVVLVYGDEACRIPAFPGNVRAVFKCYGSRPVFCDSIRPSYTTLLSAAQFTRNFLFWLPGWLRHQIVRWSSAGAPSVYTIPLGYFKQHDLTPKKFRDRRFTLSFVGSLHHEEYQRWSVKAILGTPKGIARMHMLAALVDIKKRRRDIEVYYGLTKDYHDSRMEDSLRYSKIMRDTKICLVPRGTSYETFRFFEAMRYGCVVICEALPKHWFYEGSPAIRVRNWKELPEIVSYFMRNAHELQRLHEATLAWWDQKCSERALAAFMAAALREGCNDAGGEMVDNTD